MPVNVFIELRGFDQAEKALAGLGEAFPRAISDAINYGLRAGTTMAAKAIHKRYNIKSADVKADGFKVKKANYHNLEGQMAASGPMLPLAAFDPHVKLGRINKAGGVHKSIKKNGKNYQYVFVTIIRGGGRKLVKGAFKGKGRFWERRPVGTKEHDAMIGPVSAIGIPHMLGQLGIATQVQDRINDKADERLQHNVARELAKGHATGVPSTKYGGHGHHP